MQATRTLYAGRGQGGDITGRGEMESNGGGRDHTRSQDLRMLDLSFCLASYVYSVTLLLTGSLSFSLKHLINIKMYLIVKKCVLVKKSNSLG